MTYIHSYYTRVVWGKKEEKTTYVRVEGEREVMKVKANKTKYLQYIRSSTSIEDYKVKVLYSIDENVFIYINILCGNLLDLNM